jgi:UPF0042 nucleotide-binding protein
MTEAAPGVRLLVVTGMSGAGKSSALRILEDLGFEAVDNLPLGLLEHMASGFGSGRGRSAPPPAGVAVGIDSRTRGFAAAAFAAKIADLRRRPDLEVSVVFLDCDDEILANRFQATRRPHPLALDRPVADGIGQERSLMQPVRELADAVIDSSYLTLPDLKRMLVGHFARSAATGPGILVTSFAYGSGLPRDADLVFDARFLQNPNYVPNLRPQSGRAPEVAAFIAADPAFAPFLAAALAILGPMIERYGAEGKRLVTVAIGCTGGRHRSVVVVERIAEKLRQEGWRVLVRHRDLGGAASPVKAGEEEGA